VSVTELLLEQEKRIAALERRLAGLEQYAITRPQKPRLLITGRSDDTVA
jgi:hypothetical protein